MLGDLLSRVIYTIGWITQTVDSFKIDGNIDGIGDNANIIQIAELEKKKVFGGEEGFSFLKNTMF